MSAYSHKANERLAASQDIEDIELKFFCGEASAAAVLTLQPCGCLSGCARRWRAPARVYPSDPEAAPAPPAALSKENKVKGSPSTHNTFTAAKASLNSSEHVYMT